MNALPRVMVDAECPDAIRRRLQTVATLVAWNEQPGAEERDVTGMYTFGHPLVNRQLLASLPSLRVISNHGVGVDHIDVEAARSLQIPVGNTPAVLDGAVADLAFALLLSSARRLSESARVASAPETTHFDQMSLHGQDVFGRTLGIVGLGRIGCEVARRASGFDLRVLYCNRQPRPPENLPGRPQYVDLETLLRTADFVVLTVPLTAQTRGMIGATQLSWLRPTAILVNVSRGPVVDTAALVDALQRRQLLAAALDVTDPEPLPRDHPLLQMPNVLVTSHIGSATVQTRQRMADLSLENLRLGLAGQPLRASV